MDDLIAVLELLGTSYFLTGVRIGSVALALGWAFRFALGRDKPPLPIGGILVAVATLATLARVEEAIPVELPAMGAMIILLLLGRVFRAQAWVYPLLVLPGASWLAVATQVTNLGWVRALIVVTIPLVGFLINDFERRHSPLGLGVIFYSIAVIGAFAAVPDTEWAVALVAATLPITFLAWPRVAVSLGTEGAYLAVAVFVWVVAQGGGARPSSIVGSIACFGLLLLEPLLLLAKPGMVKVTTWFNHTALGAVLASLPQFFIMVFCSRVAARSGSLLPAIIAIAIIYTFTVLGAVIVSDRAVKADEEIFEDAPNDVPDQASSSEDGLEAWYERSDDPWA